MGTRQSEGRLEPRTQSLTAEEADRIVAALRRIYLEGYITGTTLETVTAPLNPNVNRAATARAESLP